MCEFLFFFWHLNDVIRYPWDRIGTVLAMDGMWSCGGQRYCQVFNFSILISISIIHGS